MAQRGHEVTILHTITPLGPKLFNDTLKTDFNVDDDEVKRSNNGSVIEISPQRINNLFAKYFDNPFAFQRETRHGKGVLRLKKMFNIMRDACREIYGDGVFRKVVDEGKFDLAIVQGILNDCVLGAVDRMGIPFMYLSPGPVFPSIQVSHTNHSAFCEGPVHIRIKAVIVVSNPNTKGSAKRSRDSEMIPCDWLVR